MARNTKLKSETEAPENIPFTMKKMARLAKCQPEDSGIEMVMARVEVLYMRACVRGDPPPSPAAKSVAHQPRQFVVVLKTQYVF